MPDSFLADISGCRFEDLVQRSGSLNHFTIFLNPGIVVSRFHLEVAFSLLPRFQNTRIKNRHALFCALLTGERQARVALEAARPPGDRAVVFTDASREEALREFPCLRPIAEIPEDARERDREAFAKICRAEMNLQV
ncbi:hypothetical protein GCM10007108_09800 [Thermogymnomonas acidicola]|uniref:Uncharacterized protein n=1 Tax=Thermogymnomonas acidicola TaxID=399579 RepID=A0AA37BRC8_9ARCH|nr:hypothetical protein [Thermogymnomonas acidicola]GGM73873.1 hypothetical protein GCM10007108_09800 [Thermogymnomonas acidicola]